MSTTAKQTLAELPATTAEETVELMGGDERDAVLHAYQDTMRQFLATQESIMMAYLTGEARPQITSARPAPRRIAPAPVRRPVVAAAPAPQAVAAPPPVARPQPTIAPPTAAPAPAPQVVPVPTPAAAAPAPQPARPASPPAAESKPAPAAAPSGGTLDADGIRVQLLELVEDRTGYPQEMLDLDQHIEADLGIDSIKRVEIVGALLKALPESMVAGNAALSDELNGQTTLRGMIDHLASQNGVAAASSA